MSVAYIYKIENLINGKFYIGSTTNPRNRNNSHFSDLRLNRHHCKYLQNSYNKYGPDKFKFKILLKCYAEQQYYIEQEFIDKLKPTFNLNKIASKPPAQKGKTWKCKPEAAENIRKSVLKVTQREMNKKLKAKEELIIEFINNTDNMKEYASNKNLSLWQFNKLVRLYCSNNNIDYKQIKTKKLSHFNTIYKKEEKDLIYNEYLNLKDLYSDRQIIKLGLLPISINRGTLIKIKKEYV